MTQKVPPDGVCTNTVDRRAQKLVDSWTAAVGKLRDLKPEIEWVQAEFKDRKGSETILGCRNFKTFCTTHLKRTEQAIYAMLGDYTAKAKGKKHPGAGSTARSTTVSTTLAQDSIERLKEAVDAAARHFELKQRGKEDEAKKMEETFHSIAKAEMLPGPMFSVSQRELMADFISANLDD